MATKLTGRARRRIRVRKKISGTAERPRLNVFRSAKHIYAQAIDDLNGTTLASVSTASKDMRAKLDGDKVSRAKAVGLALAEACKAKNVSAVVFDRNGYKYHGRVRAVAEGAREGGLEF
ncbi:MAG: 50S ribosomal protein L18 [Myxococcota bacterium]